MRRTARRRLARAARAPGPGQVGVVRFPPSRSFPQCHDALGFTTFASRLRLPGASPHALMPSVSPDDLMFGPTFSDFLPLVRRRFGGSGTRMDVRSAVLVGSFRAARLPARYNFSRDPRWISADLSGVSRNSTHEAPGSSPGRSTFGRSVQRTIGFPHVRAPQRVESERSAIGRTVR